MSFCTKIHSTYAQLLHWWKLKQTHHPLYNQINSDKSHTQTIKQLQQRLNTNVSTGLSQQQAEARLQQFGENVYDVQQSQQHWSIPLFFHLINGISLLSWIAAAISFVVYALNPSLSYGLYAGQSIMIVVTIVNLLDYILIIDSNIEVYDEDQEYVVIRNSKPKVIKSKHLVRGDVLKLEPQTYVTADLRIVEHQNLSIDSNLVTGLQNLQLKNSKISTAEIILLSENMVFQGSTVKQGSGVAVCTNIGSNTILNLIRKKIKNEPKTSLYPQCLKSLNYISGFWLSFTIIIFGIGFAIGRSMNFNLLFLLSILVGSTSISLFLQITIILRIVAKQLKRKNIHLNNMDKICRLGMVSCLMIEADKVLFSSDSMVPAKIWYSNMDFDIRSKLKYDPKSLQFKNIAQAAILNTFPAVVNSQFPEEEIVKEVMNDMSITYKQKIKRIIDAKRIWSKGSAENKMFSVIGGDGDDAAVLRFLNPTAKMLEKRKKYPQIFKKEIQGYKVSVHEYKDSQYCIFTMGEVRKVWSLCSHVNQFGSKQEKTEKNENLFSKDLQGYEKKYRGIGFSRLYIDKQKFDQYSSRNFNDFPIKHQEFLGYILFQLEIGEEAFLKVSELQSANIKIIFTTKQSQEIALQVAKKVGLITGLTVDEIPNIPWEQAFNKTDSLVVTGKKIDQLLNKNQRKPVQNQNQNSISNQNFKKQVSLEECLLKHEVVFAQINQSHRKIILDMYQKIGFVVAVASSQNSDAASLHQADIGIFIKSYSEHPEMLVLHEGIGNIVKAIQEGRHLIDNLRKCICFNLTSQIAETMPFIIYIFLGIPLPINVIMLLYLKVAIYLLPGICFSLEQVELDLMFKNPLRKHSQLVNMRMLAQSYGYIGWLQLWGALLAYFVTFNDFGFDSFELLKKVSVTIIPHNIYDQYNPTDPYYGNSNLSNNSCPQGVALDWNFLSHSAQDLRMAAVQCKLINQKAVYTQIFQNWKSCSVPQMSPVTNMSVCYTTQAFKYAQTSYFMAIVWCQIINMYVCKTKTESIIETGFSNKYLNLAGLCMICMAFLTIFFLPINLAFGTRDVVFWHFGTVCLPFAILQLIINEIKKILILYFPDQDENKPNIYQRLFYW